VPDLDAYILYNVDICINYSAQLGLHWSYSLSSSFLLRAKSVDLQSSSSTPYLWLSIPHATFSSVFTSPALSRRRMPTLLRITPESLLHLMPRRSRGPYLR
jgi:hypothetical protein